MAVYQTTWWVCDYCGHHEYSTELPIPYDAPRIKPPSGGTWGFIDDSKIGDRYRLACPDCLEKGLFQLFERMEKKPND